MHPDNLFVIQRTSFSRIQVYLIVDRTREIKAQARSGDLPPSDCTISRTPGPHAPRAALQCRVHDCLVRRSREVDRALPRRRRRVWFTLDRTLWRCGKLWLRLLTVYAGAEAYSRRLMPQKTHHSSVRKRDPRSEGPSEKETRMQSTRLSGWRYIFPAVTNRPSTRGKDWHIFSSQKPLLIPQVDRPE